MVQVICMTIAPALLVIGQVVWLSVLSDLHLNQVYYNWVICDVILNSVGTVLYLIQLERISFEQTEAQEVHLKSQAMKLIEKPKAKGLKKLSIGKDYYSFAFVAMMRHYRHKCGITHEQRANFFINVLLIFGIQMTLLFLAYYDMTLQATDDEGFLTSWHIDIVLCRVILGFLAHLQTEPEVRQAIRMFKYALNHGKAKGSVIDLYKKTCGKRFPLPENPQELTNQMLAKAYRHFKEYHRKLPIPCRHEIPSDVEFLLDLAS